MKTTIALSVLLISAASATPSFANYFHNPYMGLNRSIGSAPSPTPRDVRGNRLPQTDRSVPPTTGAGTKSAEAEPNAPRREASNR
jgi:hypothetical protein